MDVTDRDTFWTKISPATLFRAIKEYIVCQIDSIDEDINIHTNLIEYVRGYSVSIAFLAAFYHISYIEDQHIYRVVSTTLLAFSLLLTIQFRQQRKEHQLLHLANRSFSTKYPTEKILNRDVPVLLMWEPSIFLTIFVTWCNPFVLALPLMANIKDVNNLRTCLFGYALLLGHWIRDLFSLYKRKMEDQKMLFEEAAFISSQFYEKNYVLSSPEARAANSQSSPDLLNASASSGSNNNSTSMRTSNSGISPTKTVTSVKENQFTEYGTNYGLMSRKPTVPITYGTSQADASPPRRESPVRSAPSSNPSSRHSSMEFPTISGLFSLMDNNRPSSFYGHGNHDGNSNSVYGLANAPPYTPHIVMNGSHDMHMMDQDPQQHQQQPQRRTTFGLDQDPPTSSLYDF